ncbi:MAG: CidA/LrgA family protein [Lachnospiraceae bacterium]
MKYLKQLAIVLIVSLLAELMAYLIPLPVAASVYGLVLMLIGLITHIIPLRMVEDVGDFLVENMGIMFVPPTVGIIACVDELKQMWIPLLVSGIFTTFLIMIITGLVTQALVKKTGGKS